jgi:hypothetical protein
MSSLPPSSQPSLPSGRTIPTEEERQRDLLKVLGFSGDELEEKLLLWHKSQLETGKRYLR